MWDTEGEARVYNFLKYTTTDGLAGNNVYCITQDKDGFIWIATETGVSRFDGSSFKNYTVRDGLPGNDVNWLFVDLRNRIWMSPFKTEVCYFYRGRIHNKDRDAWMKKIVLSAPQKSIAEDNAGNLLLHSHEVINYITANNICRTYPFTHTGDFTFKPVRQVGQLPLAVLDTSFRKYASTFNGREVFSKDVTLSDVPPITVEINNGKRFLTIYKMDGTRDVVTQPANLIGVGLGIQIIPIIVLNTQNGSYLFNIRTRSITDTLLDGMAINTSYTDRDSGIWLGTNGNGLFYFPPGRSISVRHPVSNVPVNVYHFYSDKQRIWVGTNNWDLWQLDQRNQILKPVKENEIDKHLIYPQAGNLLRRTELSILKVLTERRGAVLPESKGLKSLMNVGDTVIGTQPHTVYRYFSLQRVIDSINFDERLTCSFYHGGTYYIGTLNGLFAVPGGVHLYSLKGRRPLIKGVINSIAYSRENGLFWAATSEDGVYCFDGNTHRVVKHFNEQNGLSSPVCTDIFTDGAKVYIGTIDGVNIIDPAKDFSIDCYYTLDGLPSNYINCILASGNKVWVGTTDGLSCIDVTARNRKPLLRLCLTQVLVSGKEVISDTNNIRLKPKDNNIRFDYSGISFASMGKVKYYYRLRGLSATWQSTDQSYLQYPSLPSGTYTLELYAVDRFNTHSNLINFTFTIVKKWWEYSWVQFLGLLLVLGLTAGVLWLRIARSQRREREKVALSGKIIELEQLALRSQMNPHFIFNSLNSFYQYVIDKDLEGASKFMSDFSRLIRLLFETTALYEITLDKEIDFLSTYLELERTKLGNIFCYHIALQPDILTEEITLPSFIIQPFIENSIWHGIQNRKDNDGKITLAITADTDWLTISIDDNGVGRAYTDELKKRTTNIHNSRGIALTEERISLYNKTHNSSVRFEITDKYENNVPSGTQVILKFPLKIVA